MSTKELFNEVYLTKMYNKLSWLIKTSSQPDKKDMYINMLSRVSEFLFAVKYNCTEETLHHVISTNIFSWEKSYPMINCRNWHR